MLKESSTDLLIVGAGPAGLMMACWASQFDINVRLIDDKHSRIETGRADGLQPRTLEIFDSFGFVQAITSAGEPVEEICSWNPDPNRPTEIQRYERVKAQVPRLSRYAQTGLNQGAIEAELIKFLQSKRRVVVERDTKLESLVMEDENEGDSSCYPVHVFLSSIKDTSRPGNRGSTPGQVVKAKYVVGCDGASSSVRDILKIKMSGDTTEKHFGVMDIVPLTDFPDIRQSCVIHSKQGSIMTIPRENRLVRFYVQLDETVQNSHGVNPSNFTAESILAFAKSILQPYYLDFNICNWSSVYTIGQRLATEFDHKNRVFLAGDAAHTHSPTMGQGMNVSIQDSFNLGWKLGAVLEGAIKPDILSTYYLERSPVAKELLTLDRKMAEFYSEGPSRDSNKYQSFRERFSSFMTGVSVTYAPNSLVSAFGKNISGQTASREYAKHIVLGQRLQSGEINCQASGIVVSVSQLLQSNGNWRIIVLPGDLRRSQVLKSLESLSPTLGYLVNGSKQFHSQIKVYVVHTSPRLAVDLLDLPGIYHHWDPEYGRDYWTVYSEEQDKSPDHVYDQWGVARDVGCILIVRPDQHVAGILGLDETKNLEEFFTSFYCIAAERSLN